jgi:hypothetical protein
LVFEIESRAWELWSARISALPRLDVWNAGVGEGRLGDGFARVEVTLAEPTAGDVTVSFRTEEGSAKAGTDLLPVAGTLTIAAGSRGPVVVTVPIVDDPLPEEREEFFVRLAGATGALIGRSSATVTIDDDGYGRPSPRRRLYRENPP